MDLFYLLGMLPGGIFPKDLDYMWDKIVEYKNIESTPKRIQQQDTRWQRNE